MKIIFNPFPEVDMSDLPLVFCMANIPNYVLYVEILKRLYCIYLYALCHLSGRACRTIPWCFSVSGRSPRVPPGSHSADLEAGEPGSGRSVVQREEQRDGGGDGLSATAEGWGFNYTPVHSSVHLYTHTHTGHSAAGSHTQKHVVLFAWSWRQTAHCVSLWLRSSADVSQLFDTVEVSLR